MHRPYEVKPATTITAFIGPLGPGAGLRAGASDAGAEDNAGNHVIVNDVMVADRSVESADDQNSFVKNALHRESGNGHIAEAGIVETVQKDAMRKAGGVNNGPTGAGADQ